MGNKKDDKSISSKSIKSPSFHNSKIVNLALPQPQKSKHMTVFQT